MCIEKTAGFIEGRLRWRVNQLRMLLFRMQLRRWRTSSAFISSTQKDLLSRNPHQNLQCVKLKRRKNLNSSYAQCHGKFSQYSVGRTRQITLMERSLLITSLHYSTSGGWVSPHSIFRQTNNSRKLKFSSEKILIHVHFMEIRTRWMAGRQYYTKRKVISSPGVNIA